MPNYFSKMESIKRYHPVLKRHLGFYFLRVTQWDENATFLQTGLYDTVCHLLKLRKHFKFKETDTLITCNLTLRFYIALNLVYDET